MTDDPFDQDVTRSAGPNAGIAGGANGGANGGSNGGRPVRKDEIELDERGIYVESWLPERRSRRRPPGNTTQASRLGLDASLSG